MESVNPTVLIPAIVGLCMLITLAYLALVRNTSAAAKKMQSRLSGIKQRHGNAPLQLERSIRVNRPETGLAGRVAELLPRRDAIKARLGRAGMKQELGRYTLFCILVGLCAAAALFAIGFSLLPAILFGVAAGAGLPHHFVGFKAGRRINRFTKQFPEAIDLMVRGLKSGLPVNETINNVATEVAAPLGHEFKAIVDAMRLGKTLEETLWDTARRLDTPDFKFFVTSLSVQRETGGNLAETLGNLSTILRARQQMKLKVRALSSEAKASAWIVGALPFIMLGLIMLVNFDYGIVLFTHPAAIMASGLALIWMSIGIFVMAKMIRFEV